MKWIVALAALLCAAPASPQVVTGPNTRYFSGMPPLKYQGDAAQVVVFASDISAYCGTAPEGMTIVACVRTIGKTPVIFLPNPCPIGDLDYYARIACHELGHRNSWPGDHPL